MDELALYLKNTYGDHFFTGEEDCNILLWGSNSGGVVLPRLCTLIVGLEYDPLHADQQRIANELNFMFLNNPAFQKIHRYGTKFAHMRKIQYITIVYPKMREQFDQCWERSVDVYPLTDVLFYIKFTGQNGMMASGRDLSCIFHNILGVENSDIGTSKAKNKKLADYFHLWSRCSLSRHIVKLDIDGFFLSENGDDGILIEIKRSNVNPWAPYYDDRANYFLQDLFAKEINAKFWLLQHDKTPCSPGTRISFYDITGTDPENRKHFLTYSQAVTGLPLAAPEGMDSFDNIIKRALI